MVKQNNTKKISQNEAKNIQELVKSCLATTLETPSSRSHNYINYTNFRLSVYAQGIAKINDNYFAGLKFHQYRLKQQSIQKIVDEIRGEGRTLVSIGHCPVKQNSPIGGYARCPILGIEHGLASNEYIDLVYVPEAFSTKTCSYDHTEPE